MGTVQLIFISSSAVLAIGMGLFLMIDKAKKEAEKLKNKKKK